MQLLPSFCFAIHYFVLTMAITLMGLYQSWQVSKITFLFTSNIILRMGQFLNRIDTKFSILHSKWSVFEPRWQPENVRLISGGTFIERQARQEEAAYWGPN